MRIIVILVALVLAGIVVLWQVDVINLPFGSGGGGRRQAAPAVVQLVQAGDLSTLQASLAEGADIDARDTIGQTPLIYAVSEAPDLAMMATLLDAGADVNARTDAGWTPLMYAARDAASPEPVLMLLNAGADPTVVAADGESAVTLASQNSAVRNSGLYPRLVELSERPFTQGWPSGFVTPVEGATISSRASHLPGAPRAYRNGTHEGFDFYNGTVSVPIEYGTPIRVVADGTVVRADTTYTPLTIDDYNGIIGAAKQSLSTPPEVLDRLRGRQVWVQHPGGFLTRYAHLSGIAEGIAEGSVVGQGQVIGFTGNSGTVEAAQGTQDDPHPHVEIWHGDTYLGQNLEPAQIYPLAAQVFGQAVLPPYTGE